MQALVFSLSAAFTDRAPAVRSNQQQEPIMQPIVAVIAPGMMGSAVAKRLTANGLEVRTLLEGRGADTLARPRTPA